MKNSQDSRLLMIGPLPPPEGGARMSFQYIVKELDGRPNVDVAVIATWPPEAGLLRKILPALKVMLRTISKAKNAYAIAFFASPNGVILWSPVIHLVARLFGKPWILRVFGGGFDSAYADLPGWFKPWFLRTGFSADLVLLQTKHLVQHFREISLRENVFWHANFRPLGSQEARPAREKCRKFVFLGYVKPSKGINEILQASRLLEQDVSVHVYGLLRDGITETDFANFENVDYCGVLKHEQVFPTLREYDALLLPSYYHDEGYPGVIIEAYIAGMPVIASRLQAISEIVDDSCGLLVTPRDYSELASAMRRLVSDEILYQELSRGAWEKRTNFSLEFWTDRFIEYCEAVIVGKVPDEG